MWGWLGRRDSSAERCEEVPARPQCRAGAICAAPDGQHAETGLSTGTRGTRSAGGGGSLRSSGAASHSGGQPSPSSLCAMPAQPAVAQRSARRARATRSGGALALWRFLKFDVRRGGCWRRARPTTPSFALFERSGGLRRASYAFARLRLAQPSEAAQRRRMAETESAHGLGFMRLSKGIFFLPPVQPPDCGFHPPAGWKSRHTDIRQADARLGSVPGNPGASVSKVIGRGKAQGTCVCREVSRGFARFRGDWGCCNLAATLRQPRLDDDEKGVASINTPAHP